MSHRKKVLFFEKSIFFGPYLENRIFAEYAVFGKMSPLLPSNYIPLTEEN